MATHATPTTPEIFTVKIITIGGIVKEVALNGEHTVYAALEAAGMDSSAEVRCNNEVYKGEDLVDNGDQLFVMAGEKPKGGSF